MNKNKTIAIVGIGSSISFVLGQVILFKAPQGGSVSLFAVPIIIIAAKFGFECSMYVAITAAIFSMMRNAVIIHPFQVILDYFIPNMCFCIIYYFRKNSKKIILGIILAYFLNFFSHFICGIIYYGQFAPKGQPVWIYSLIYNISTMIPELLIVGITSHILYIKLIGNKKYGS